MFDKIKNIFGEMKYTYYITKQLLNIAKLDLLNNKKIHSLIKLDKNYNNILNYDIGKEIDNKMLKRKIDILKNNILIKYVVYYLIQDMKKDKLKLSHSGKPNKDYIKVGNEKYILVSDLLTIVDTLKFNGGINGLLLYYLLSNLFNKGFEKMELKEIKIFEELLKLFFYKYIDDEKYIEKYLIKSYIIIFTKFCKIIK